MAHIESKSAQVTVTLHPYSTKVQTPAAVAPEEPQQLYAQYSLTPHILVQCPDTKPVIKDRALASAIFKPV